MYFVAVSGGLDYYANTGPVIFSVGLRRYKPLATKKRKYFFLPVTTMTMMMIVMRIMGIIVMVMKMSVDYKDDDDNGNHGDNDDYDDDKND